MTADDEELRRLETNHRIANELSSIASILTLSADDAASVETAVALREASERINAVALVHKLLQDASDQDTVRVDDVLAELCELMNRMSPDTVLFDGGTGDAVLPSGSVTRLAMIVRELAALIRSRGNATATVRTRKTTKALTVSVLGSSDGGAGIELDTVGSLIVDGFAKQIGAEFERREVDGAPAFQLRLDRRS